MFTNKDSFQDYFNHIADGLACQENERGRELCVPARTWGGAKVTAESLPTTTTVYIGWNFVISAPLSNKVYTKGDREFLRTFMPDTFWALSALTLQPTADGVRARVSSIDWSGEEERSMIDEVGSALWEQRMLFPEATTTIEISPKLKSYLEELRTKELPPRRNSYIDEIRTNTSTASGPPSRLEDGTLVWDDDGNEFRFRKVNEHLWIGIAQTDDKTSVMLFTDRYK